MRLAYFHSPTYNALHRALQPFSRQEDESELASPLPPQFQPSASFLAPYADLANGNELFHIPANVLVPFANAFGVALQGCKSSIGL